MKRPTIVSLLAILNFIGAAISVAIGCLFAVLSSRPAAVGSILPLMAILFLLGGVFNLFTGLGLWRLHNYGRILQMISAIVGLLAFPVGTILSTLILVYFVKPEVKILFSGRRPEELSPPELSMLAVFERSGSGTAIVVAVAVFVLMVFMGGIIAAIAVPNFLNAVQRGKQKRTMADLRAIATACEEYAVDNNQYPAGRSIGEVAGSLEPKYIKVVPRVDAWGNEFIYVAWDSETGGIVDKYMIVSAGKDGVLEHADDVALYENGGATQDFNNDIAFSAGSFVQWPESRQN